MEAVPLPLPAYNEPVVWRLQEKAQIMNQTDAELLLDCLPSVVPVECENAKNIPLVLFISKHIAILRCPARETPNETPNYLARAQF